MKYCLNLIGTVVFALILPAHLLSHVDPCTMGSTDGFAAGFLLFLLFGVISIPLLLATFSSNYSHRWIVLFIGTIVIVGSIEPGINATFNGAHLCDVLEEGATFGRLNGENIHFYYYPTLWLICSLGIVLSKKPRMLWLKLISKA